MKLIQVAPTEGQDRTVRHRNLRLEVTNKQTKLKLLCVYRYFCVTSTCDL